jgi:hypothetical protein
MRWLLSRVPPRCGSSRDGSTAGGFGSVPTASTSWVGLWDLTDGRILVRAVWPPADLTGSGYTVRSGDGGATWGDQLYPLPVDAWRVWPTLIRPLRDGRLVLLAGCWRRGEMTPGSSTPRLLRKMMFVSADQGRTWSAPIELMAPAKGVCVIGHVGSDDVYGTVDQSIRQQSFRVKVTRQQ